MNLLGQEEVKEKNTGKKVVLSLLIIAIILLAIIIATITVLSKNQGPKTDTLFIDDIPIQITEDLILSDEAGNKYIGLKDFASKIEGYVYYDGEYRKYVEDKNKCYLDNTNEVIGFEGGTNKIYKTTQESITDYEQYELISNIINSNGKLYINVDDIQKAFRVQVNYTMSNNKAEIKIYTMDFLEEYYNSKLQEREEKMLLSTDYNNKKMLADGLLVVSLNGKYGLLDSNFETKIGMKFNSMLFNEYTENFIVAISTNKVGLIDNNGKIKVEPEYDSIKLINHFPILYEVKSNNKYGILKENGENLTNIEYDKLGSEGNVAQNTKSVLIMPNVKNNQSGIVVSKDKKYGIINIVTGKEVGSYDLDKVYSRVSQSTDEVQYFVEIGDNVIDLKQYLDYANTMTVNVNN